MPHLVSDEYEAEGVLLMAYALKQPIKVLVENKTGENCAHILNKIDEQDSLFCGYDLKKGKDYLL